MNPTNASAANLFAELARGFCSWCEGSSLGVEREVIASQWLAKLHAGALSLPEVGLEYSEEFPEIQAELLESVHRNLGCFRGMYYREYFDPDPTLTDESVMGEVGDDLSDIYTDIRRGLVLFERGELVEALWHWSFLHRIHWGRHAVGAMFALHCLVVSKSKS